MFYLHQTDPRVEQYPFLGSPFPIALLVVAYVYFVLRLGPWLMRDRKPFDLTNVINVYNFFQICANLYLGLWVGNDNDKCVRVFRGNRLTALCIRSRDRGTRISSDKCRSAVRPSTI